MPYLIIKVLMIRSLTTSLFLNNWAQASNLWQNVYVGPSVCDLSHRGGIEQNKHNFQPWFD